MCFMYFCFVSYLINTYIICSVLIYIIIIKCVFAVVICIYSRFLNDDIQLILLFIENFNKVFEA